MGKTFNIYALSAISLALLSVYPAAQAADPIRITGQTEYSGAYKNVPVTVETGGELYGTDGETEMVIQGGRYETAPQVLSVSGIIRDAASLNVDGGSTIRDTGTVSNINTVIFTNTYNHHIDNGVQGNLSLSLTNEGTITNVGTLLVDGSASSKGTIDVGTLGSDAYRSGFTVTGGTLKVADGAYFDVLRIDEKATSAKVDIGGTLDVSTGFRLQANVTAELDTVTGSGYVRAEKGVVDIDNKIQIDQYVSARTGGRIEVNGNITSSAVQAELGGQVSAGSVTTDKISASGDGSSIHITGVAQTNAVDIQKGSSLKVYSLTARTGTELESFSNEGTVILDSGSLNVRTFTNKGSINATNGVSHLDQLTISQGGSFTGDMNIDDFNISGSVTVQPDSTLTVDKLGTSKASVQAVTVNENSTINVTGDAYFNHSISGSGLLKIAGKANFVAEYQQIRNRLSAGSVETLGMTSLEAGACLDVETDLTVGTASQLLVNTTELFVGNDFIVNGAGKVQMRDGSDGAIIINLVLNTTEGSFFQTYKNLTVHSLQVNGYGTIETYATDGDSSLSIGTVTAAADAVVAFVNEGTFGGYQSTASIGTVTLGDGATLSNSGGSRTEGETQIDTPPFAGMTIGSVNGTNAVIQSDAGGSMSIDTLSGSGNRIEVESVESGVTVTHNSSSGLVYQTGGTDADKLGTQQALLAAAEMIGESDEGFETAVADGLVNGSGSAAFDQNGNMIYSSTGESLTMSALKQFSNATLAQWRYETNHLSDRLGEVRRNLGAAGAWARIYGADTDVTDTVTTEIKTNTIQVGGDATVGGNWIVGGAFSYTNMDGTISNGSAEGETYSLAAYASGFFDCGGYIDIIGRIGRLSSDINAYTSSGRLFDGSYDNTALGLSVETGYHWRISDVFFMEPQAEFSYGVVFGDDFTTSSGVKVEQDDFQSLVGRIGARIGADFPEKAGNFYVQASVNHEFLGDNDFDAAYQGYSKQHFTSELDGTWVSYGVGLQLNASDALSIYGSLSRANGSDYQDDYRYSIGARYVW